MAVRGGFRVSAIEAQLMFAGILVAVAVSLTNDIWHFLPPLWELPLALFALFFLLRWVDQLRSELRSTTVDVKHYQNRPAFYDDLAVTVRQADRRVYATYEHRRPPADHPERAGYDRDLMQWTREQPHRRQLLRLIRVPLEDEAMRRYAQDQLALAHEIPNYEVRILPARGHIDGRSFVVIDNTRVFTSFSTQNPPGFRANRVHSSEMATDYEAHFVDLWGIAYPQLPDPSTADTPRPETARPNALSKKERREQKRHARQVGR